MPETTREVALGYHSPTEWVFIPHVLVLYDSFVINKSVFDGILEKASTSPSDYERRKADMLRLLESEGRLRPTAYTVPSACQAQLTGLVDFFFERRPDDMRRLSIGAFRAFKEHELGTVRELMHRDDPHALDVLSNVPSWEQAEAELRTGKDLAEVPHLKQSIRRYFENCLFSPMLFPEAYNPILEWEGYAPFEDWLFERRLDAREAEDRARAGSEPAVLQALSEHTVPFSPIRTEAEMGNLLEHWQDFSGIRELAEAHNGAIWAQVESAREASDAGRTQEFLKDFERFLDARAQALNMETAEAFEAIEKRKHTRSYKLIRFLLATLGSTVPGSGGAQQSLEALYDRYVENETLEGRPEVATLIQYERNMKNQVLERKPLRPVCRIDAEYKPHTYWNM